MKARTFMAALVVTGAVGVMGPGCAEHEGGQGTGPVSAGAAGQSGQSGWREPGGSVTATVTGMATVKAVDRANRTVTLEKPDGTVAMYKCGPQMVNFDQIKEGDRVRATMIERVAVSVGKAGEAGGAQQQPAEGGVVMLAPKGGRPGVILANTDVKQFRVASVDPKARTASLEPAGGGKAETIKVGHDVDLSGVKKGDMVTVRYTEGLALLDEKGAGAAAAPGEAQPAGARVGPGGEGMEGVETMTRTATVESVDREKREVTLKGEGGQTRTIHLGKDVRNFDQIHPGDKVTATLAEEMAVDVTKGGKMPGGGEGVMVARAPKGAKPGVLIAQTEVETGKVDSVDAAKRTMTLTGADGKKKTLKVGPGVDLSQFQRGDDVSARVTQAVGIVVEKP